MARNKPSLAAKARAKMREVSEPLGEMFNPQSPRAKFVRGLRDLAERKKEGDEAPVVVEAREGGITRRLEAKKSRLGRARVKRSYRADG